LPDVRIPATPASTVMRGAIRLLLPTGTFGNDYSVAMPAPDTGALDVGDTEPADVEGIFGRRRRAARFFMTGRSAVTRSDQDVAGLA
jgi:hypothetical protein